MATVASHKCLFTYYQSQGSIDPNFHLLDSQSTINLFSNPNHVDNVRPDAQPIKVHCNKGVMPTGNVADFGNNEVYINPNSIVSVLSLYLLGQKHHITYDSKDRGGIFKVHTFDGLLKFTPTPLGLRALDLKEHPNTAHLLVTNTSPPESQHLHVNTVRDNFDGFTKKQIQHPQEARRLMLMTGVPLEWNFQSMVCLNQLKNCPIMHDDVKITHAIYGCDLANTRGKMVRRKPDHVETDYVEIPTDILTFHCNVTLVVDVMFVNSVPFLVSALRNMNLITIEHAPKRTASKLGHLLQCIVNVYAKAGL